MIVSQEINEHNKKLTWENEFVALNDENKQANMKIMKMEHFMPIKVNENEIC